MAITNLIELFPSGGRIEQRDRDEFNRLVDMEYDRIRDLLILHYHVTRRDDSEFWNHVRTMQVPDSLAGKIELWRSTGRVEKYGEGLFFEPSWIAVYVGQGLLPDRFDPRVGQVDPGRVSAALDRLKQAIGGEVAAMPGHTDYLRSEAARLALAA